MDDEKEFIDKGSKEKAIGSSSADTVSIWPLTHETVWLKQLQYENDEALYYAKMTTQPAIKAVVQSRKTQMLKTNVELKTNFDVLDKKFQTEQLALLKTTKNIWGRLEELEKAQSHKAKVIRDIGSRLTSIVEEFQNRVGDEVVQTATQLNEFRSLLTELEVVIEKANNQLLEQNWGSFQSHEGFCQAVTDRLTKLSTDLNSCFSYYSSFQADVPKVDINRIIGELNKISVLKKNGDGDKFVKKKNVVHNKIQVLLDDLAGIHDNNSDSSLEGSCSSEEDIEVKNDEKSLKSHVGVKQQKETSRSNAYTVANRIAGPHPVQNAVPMPVKRNAQGAQNIVQRNPDLFQFRGMSNSSHVPFSNQPGLLGPRPNTLSAQGASQQAPFRFSNFSSAGHHQVLANSGAIHNMNPLSAFNQPRFNSINFNFSNSQPHLTAFEFGPAKLAQNSLLASMDVKSSLQSSHSAGNTISNQFKQSKLLQMQQNQSKNVKGSDSLFGAKSGVFYPVQQNPRVPLFLQKSQAGLLGNHALGGAGYDNFEQQLNDMTQKIQQMQLATSHNLHLQQLLRETERLKQLVAQKQHQQHDQFKHQFQLLINAFLQQQQQLQGPQSKMAKSVQFYNSQKHQQQILHNRQLQNKKQKQNKIQNPVKEDTLQKKSNQVGFSGNNSQTTLQNGEGKLFAAVSRRRIISENSKVAKIGTFSPHAHGDKHRAGVSSIVVMEDIDSVVVVDIINSCLKLYSVTVTGKSPLELTHHLVTRLELSRPYYMSRLSKDLIVVSREGKLLSLVRVSKNKLECLKDLKTESQYYGLGYIKDNAIVCAAFADGKIDLLDVKDGVTQTVTLLTQCKGPELVAAVPNTGCILYLERLVSQTVHLKGISQKGVVEFSVNLESSPTDVWSVASIANRIVCCSKETGKVKLLDEAGKFLTDVNFPAGSVNQPFAMAFCDSGNMYIANDGAWDSEYEHYVTTDINAYEFL